MNLFGSVLPSLFGAPLKSFFGNVLGDAWDSIKRNGRNAVYDMIGPPNPEGYEEMEPSRYNKRPPPQDLDEDDYYEDEEQPIRRRRRRRPQPRYR